MSTSSREHITPIVPLHTPEHKSTMRLKAEDLPAMPEEEETLAAFDRVQPIQASDTEIEAAVRDADLPALLATLAMLTQDPALLADELKPPSPSMTARIAPQGGM